MKNYFSLINKLILVILAFLGFSCDPDEPVVEYGMPTADFKVTGNIVDETTQENLNNIQVILSDVLSSSRLDNDTSYTDENGNFEVQLSSLPTNTAFLVQFKDPDGNANGAYLPLDSLIDFSDQEFVNGDGSWYSGEKSIDLDIELDPDNS